MRAMPEQSHALRAAAGPEPLPAGAVRGARRSSVPVPAVTSTAWSSTQVLVVLPLSLLAVATLVLASLATGAGPAAALPGIPDAGAWTGWALRVSEVLVLVAGVLCTGALLVRTVLLPAADRGSAPARGAARAAAGWAVVWAALSVAAAVLVVADTRATPALRLLAGTSPRRLLVDAPAPALAHLLGAAVAVAVAALLLLSRDHRAAWVAAGLAPLALLPPVLAGHAGAVADQDVVASGLAVHVVAASVWVGGLVGLLVHLRRWPDLRALAVTRFSVLAGGAYAALAVSGIAPVTVTLPAWSSWTSGYGALVAAKAALLLALGWCGHLHRRRLRRDADHGARGVFVRLALAEVVLMAVAGGLAAALSRTPLPVVPDAPAHGLGHPGLAGVVEPVSALGLVVAVRPNALALVVVLGLLAAYLAAVRRLHAAGGTWPVSRTRSAVAAAVVAVVALCSGLATYAPAMLSVQVAQLLLLLLVVPVLVARAAPSGLRRRPGSAAPDATAPDPVLGAVAVGALLVLVYRTPLLELTQRSHWLHLVLLLLAVVAGTLHVRALVPPVGGGGEATHAPARVPLAALVPAGCLAVLGAQLLLGDRLVAGRWFLELRWGWVDPAADQRLAGALALGAAALLAAAVVVRLVVRLARASRTPVAPRA